MHRMTSYRDRRGGIIDLTGIDVTERRLIDDLIAKSRRPTDDSAHFHNYGRAKVDAFYSARGVSRKKIIKAAGYQVWQDLLGRLMIALGEAREEDYRDELEALIDAQFRSRREFCKQTGVSEDMLSHVLSGRKHLAIDTLVEALKRVGYTLRIVPLDEPVRPARKSAAG